MVSHTVSKLARLALREQAKKEHAAKMATEGRKLRAAERAPAIAAAKAKAEAKERGRISRAVHATVKADPSAGRWLLDAFVPTYDLLDDVLTRLGFEVDGAKTVEGYGDNSCGGCRYKGEGCESCMPSDETVGYWFKLKAVA